MIGTLQAPRGGHDLEEEHGPRTRGTVPEMVRGLRLSRHMPALAYMELILTGNCNLRCAYCWEKGKRPVDMSEETAFAAVDFLLEVSRDAKALTILLFGGEPLLRFDLMRKVWDYATRRAAERHKKISWDMTTNGTLMNEDVVKWCAGHGVKYLLSMDGGRQEHDRFRRFPDGRGSFDLIVAKVPLMKRYQPWMGVRMSVTPETCTRLASSIRELHALGINQFLLGYAHGIPWTMKDLALYETAMRDACELYLEMRYARKPFRMTVFERGDFGRLKKANGFGCGAGRGRFSVDPYGDVHGCSKMANITGVGSGVLPIGNVFQGFTRIENRVALLNNSIRPRVKCQACDFQDRCSGGCPAVNYSQTGSIYQADDLSCRMYFIDERVSEYMRRRYREVFGKEMDEEGDKNGRKSTN